jgi:SNF2 family DNA or RNA helicase
MFSTEQLAIIKQIVNSSTRILASLVRKKLPEQILDKLQEHNIDLFPTRWKDLTAACSCPDWAMPCKHLAALLYVLCDEIDKNPFTLFSLHGCDLMRMVDTFGGGNLEKEQQIPRLNIVLSPSYIEPLPSPKIIENLNATAIDAPGIFAADSADIAVPSIPLLEGPAQDALATPSVEGAVEETTPLPQSDASIPAVAAASVEPGGDGGNGRDGAVEIVTPQLDPATLDTLNFGRIDDMLENIMKIMSYEPPLFYEKDFLKIFESCYVHWRTHLRGMNVVKPTGKHTEEELFVSLWKDPAQLSTFSVDLSSLHQTAQILGGVSLPQEISNTALMNFFFNIPASYLHKLCYNLRFMHMVSIFARRLVENSAIIPQLIRNNMGFHFIRWIPALFDQNIKRLCWQFAELCPPDLITFLGAPLCPIQQVVSATSLFISAHIYGNFPRATAQHLGNSIFKAFFMQAVFTPSQDIADREIPSSIHHWLSRPFLLDKRHKLYLLVNDYEKDSFCLDVRVAIDGTLVPLATAFESRTVKIALLSELSVLFEHLPELEGAIDSNQYLIFKAKEFSRILMQVLPALRSIGVEIMLPKSLRNSLRPRLTLNLRSKDGGGSLKSFVNFDSMVDFNWQIAVGSNSLNIDEFQDLVNKSQGLIKIRDEYVVLDEQEIQQILAKTDNLPTSFNGADFMQAALAGEIDGADVNLDAKLSAFFTGLARVEPTPLPTDLHATMRPYQERGFNWLVQNIKLGFGSILADDMGLGKTLQVVALILHLKSAGGLSKGRKVIIAVPTSLLSNWQKEFEKFAPGIRFFIYHGQKRKSEKIPDDIDVLITSYGLVRRDLKELNEKKWFLFVIDEAQNIKNSQAEQTKAVKSIKAEHRIAMSGTPVENRMLEYWSIFDFTNKHYLGSQRSFVQRYAAPIERSRDAHSLEIFKKVTAPFILRRLKSDKNIISDLPEKIENNRYCSLTAQQAALYQGVVNNSLTEIEEAAGISRRGLILSMINSLKQICNHPTHYTKIGPATIPQSGKTELLEEILCEIDESSSEKVIIFTQYTEMGRILVKLLGERFHCEVPFLHGGLTRGKRDEIVNDFQTKFSIRILIVSLKAGGTGLNLTAANHVIHYDLWWNPAVETQATDRAYRIGQQKNVMVHRFLTKGTFEEKIDDMISSKRDLANLTVSSGEAFITDMTTQELQDLVSLQREHSS